MNFSKSLLILGIVSTVFISCKDTSSKPTVATNVSDIKKEVAVAAKPLTASFKIEGMTCAMGCAKTIENKLSKMDGVQKAVVDFDKKEAAVNFDSAILSSKDIVAAVQSTGDGETYKVLEFKVN
jgi:copper chaperone CopZ